MKRPSPPRQHALAPPSLRAHALGIVLLAACAPACSAESGHRAPPRVAERETAGPDELSPPPTRAPYAEHERGASVGRDDVASAQRWRHRNDPPPAQQPVAPPPPASGVVAPPPRTDPPPQRSPSLTQRFLHATGLSNILPNGGEGMTLIQIANVRLELTPSLHDPLTALGACVDRISYCYAPANASIDQCVAQAQVCQTAEPWHEADCCPAACRTAYESARRSGRDPMNAFQEVYFRNPDCFPGVRAMITRSP